ncbi:hypothetical protein [Streptomyces sp. NPDC058964]|uniref:hypothetical protein n=1 Tax=Streptomyces sp. NPDC058964 TaxID=3346681 RepID=UPI0036BF2B83
MIQQRIVLLSAAGLASALLLAACGGSADNASSGTSPAAAATVTPVATATSGTPTSVPSGTGDSGSGQGAMTTALMAKTVSGVGSVVTDDKGMTLYRYNKDQAHPSKWTCAGACVKTWLPVIAEDPVKTMGIDNSLLGTVHRDGRKQLTLGGWPLYRYIGDTRAGQANGQAKDQMWYAITPSGARGR